ncbi:MAG: M20/M25/M40 family metallo-hydrolase, partial [Candidatus Odinarchaeia archaeon]
FKVTDNKIYGRGAVDAKSPLAALIFAASQFINQKINGKLIVAAVVDEEGHSKGIRELVKQRLKANYAIFGEPSKLKYITIGYKGSLSAHIDINTPGGHSSNPNITNAIEKSIELWNSIKNEFKKYIKKSLRASITTQITGIKNQGISYSTIYINFRYPKPEHLKLIRDEVSKIIKTFNLEKDVKITYFEDEICPPYYSDKKSILVKALRESIKEVTGEEPYLITKLGTGDMNIYGSEFNIPSVTYGPGDPALDHTDSEVIDISEYKKAIEILTLCIKKIIKNKKGI